MIGALLRNGQTTARKQAPDDNTYVVAIATEMQVLKLRISARGTDIFDNGVIAETKYLADTYGWDNESMTGNIYPIIRELLAGSINKQAAIDRFIIRDRQLAKRQLTWLRRHDFVQWKSLDEAKVYLSTILDRI